MMSDEVKHTQLPWRVGSTRADGAINLVESSTGYAAFCDFELGRDEANAELIVRCVNCHGELLAIAYKYLGLITSDYETAEGKIGGGMQGAYDAALAVIAKAEPAS